MNNAKGNAKRDRNVTLNALYSWRQWLAFLGGALLLVSCLHLATPSLPPAPSEPVTAAIAPSTPPPAILITQYPLPNSTVHVIVIPTTAFQQFSIAPVLVEGLDLLDNWARQSNAIALLNGGFFDPTNQQSTSYIVTRGELTADPRQNERLVGNPSLAPYLAQIFNRTEFRHYRCGNDDHYAIARRLDPARPNCQLESVLGAGPQILPDLTLESEGFLATVNGDVVRDPLGYGRPNARSAVGILANGDVMWAMAAQQPDAPRTSGLSLPELADFMRSLGAVAAMNLDGGSSAAIHYSGQTIYGKVDEAGNSVIRPIKSMLMLQ